jgi:hypothetical protein
MKRIFQLLAVFLLVMQFFGCSMSETMSSARKYNIVIVDDSNSTIKLFVQNEAAEYVKLVPVDGVYNVSIPAMGGGYSKFLGIKFNQHKPEDYEVIKFTKGEQILKELSIKQIEALDKDKAGNYIFVVE